MNTNAAVATLPGQIETVTDAPENEYSPIDLKYNMTTCEHLRACLIILRSSSSDPHPQIPILRSPSSDPQPHIVYRQILILGSSSRILIPTLIP